MNGAAVQQMPEQTGNLLVMFEPGRKPKEVERLVSNTFGTKLVHSRDFRGLTGVAEAFLETGALSLDTLGVAVIAGTAGDGISVAATTLGADKAVRQIRPEFWMYTLNSWDERYSSWVREGLSLLAEQAGIRSPLPAGPVVPAAPTLAQPSVTWGLAATKVDQSSYSGAGIKLAVLDTGLDLLHPAFAGRQITSKSFVPNESEQDGQGHGTHCIGTACGPLSPADQIRFGVAYEAEIFVGKVLNNVGSGQEGWILAGIEWAVNSGCEVISMSLGRPVQIGEAPDEFYENAGQFALDNGSLIIAAAGNESWRQYNSIRPVSAPANSESIMAIGAVDAKMKIANFSCGGLNSPGGEVNLAGPGVDILSTFPMPRSYERLSGTSMATTHVAGIAALYAQSDSNLRGKALWNALERNAHDIGHPARDAGAGLAIAP